MTKRKKIIITSLIALIILLRVLLPSLILKQLNSYLADFSPVYSIHIDDLDIHLWRTAYRFQSVTGVLKSNNQNFLKIEAVDISLAWRELLKWRIVTDVEIYSADVLITKFLFNSSSVMDEKGRKERAEEAKGVKAKLIPYDVEKLILRDSTFQFSENLNIPMGDRLVLSNMDGTIINLTPNDLRPTTPFNAEATILGSSTIHFAGSLKMLKDPLDWDVDAEVSKYDLATANPILRRMVPITFQKGSMDLYAEAKSENGVMVGYAKPFFKNLDIIGNNDDFVSIKHFIVELVAAIGNALLKDRKTQTLATQFNFTNKGGKFEVDTGGALSKALDHGSGSPLKPALNDSVKLSK